MLWSSVLKIVEQAVHRINTHRWTGDFVEDRDSGREGRVVNTHHISGHQDRIFVGPCRIFTAKEKLALIGSAVAVEADELHAAAKQLLASAC